MAATSQDKPPTFRRDSPSPEMAPTRAIGTCPELSRCLSTASMISHGSATTDSSRPRESLGTACDMSNFSRHSSASFTSSARLSDVSGLSVDTGNRRSCSNSRYSTMSMDRPVGQRSSSRRRGYMRPYGTDFAASARQRESVLSLGSITHLQYYFARTGLLDGKGGNLRRRRNQKAQTLDFSQLDSSVFKRAGGGSDVDSSYASMGNSPDLGAQHNGLSESPVQEEHAGDEAYFDDDVSDPDDYDGAEHGMLPPTTSTYIHREKYVPKPPSMSELRAELTSALDTATKAITEAKQGKDVTKDAEDLEDKENSTPTKKTPGWFEVQGVHILDVVTLAIRAAKVYYTSHEHPHMLDSIKSEKAVRAELLSVMDSLKRMASRNFAGGIREDEYATMDGWVTGLRDMLKREDEMVAAERKEVAGWTWLRDADWSDGFQRHVEREYAFIKSLLAGNGEFPGQNAGTPTVIKMPSPTLSSFPGAVASTTASALPTTTVNADEDTLPHWTPIDRNSPLETQTVPTPFLRAMQNGKLLVRLHNGAVHKSKRRFGAIGSYHQDTAKPYRSADNIRYWVKAAELRWEVHLKGVEPLAIVYDNAGPKVWLAFEDAILDWCRKVREEITAELVTAGLV